VLLFAHKPIPIESGCPIVPLWTAACM
jgi:hypothetical protein